MIARVAAFELLGVLATASTFTGISSGVIIVEFVALAAGGWMLIRGNKAKQAISNAADAQKLSAEWRDNYLAERTAREDKEREAAEQRELKHEALNALAASQAQRDLTAVMTALVEIQKTGTRTVELIEKVERRLDRVDPLPPSPIQEAA